MLQNGERLGLQRDARLVAPQTLIDGVESERLKHPHRWNHARSTYFTRLEPRRTIRTTVSRKLDAAFTRGGLRSPYAGFVMRDAFVLRFSGESDPEQRRFIGWIEEVDTGRELHFKSTEDLLTFLARCIDDTRQKNRQSQQNAKQP